MVQTDTLLNGYKILQDPERFMFGIDAVLLSHFAGKETRNGDIVCDLGTGTGIIPLLMESTTGAAAFTALEVQSESAEMAAQSMSLNHLSQKIQVVNGDLKSVSTLFSPHCYNVVTSNPPYMINEHGRQNGTDAKSIARHEVLCTLEDVVAAADYLLKPHGKFFMIHRPFRLPEIFASMAKHKLEPKRMQLICPFAGKEPNMVLIEARKNANPRLKIEPDLNVYDKPGQYTNEVQNIYESFKRTNL